MAIRPSSPPSVRVVFSSLSRQAYLQAKKSCLITKPQIIFPLKKQRSRIVIATAKGKRVFQDKGIDTDNDDQARYEYLGYLPQFESHVILAHLWERTQWFLIDKTGKQLEFYGAPVYSPDSESFIVIAAGLEYPVYPNSLRLFRFEGQRWREVWTLEPTNWEPFDVCWSSANTLLLSKKTWAIQNLGNTLTYSKITIK
jgi:hypothetical protein